MVRTCAGAFDSPDESRRALSEEGTEGEEVESAINYAENVRSMKEHTPLKY